MTITAPAAMPVEAWVLQTPQKDVRPALDGERLIMVRRPQIAAELFAVYARGQYVRTPKGTLYVVLAVGRPHTYTGPIVREWRQALIVREPNPVELLTILALEAASNATSQHARRVAFGQD